MPKQGLGGAGFPYRNFLPDQCAADIFVTDLHRGKDIHRPLPCGAFLLEENTVPRPAPAEMEVFADDQSGNVVAVTDPIQEIGRFHLRQAPCKGNPYEAGNAVKPAKGFPLGFREKVPEGCSAEEGLRVRVERDDAPFLVPAKGSFPCRFKKPGVPEVKAVKCAERCDH
jgi:hypothetical protein